MMAYSVTQKKLEDAFWRAAKWIESTAIHYVENCISCGICYEACPAYHIDIRYSPATIAEWFRRFYRKYCTVIGRVLGRLAHAYPVTHENLLRARDYVYRCTNCGLCYLVCAAGIDSGYVASLTRVLLREAGYVPQVLLELEKIEIEGRYLTSKVKELYNGLIDELKKATGREVPIAEPDKAVLIPISVFDLLFGRDAIVATVKILERVGMTWTIPREPVGIRPPIAYVTGAWSLAAGKIAEVYRMAQELRVKMVLFVDCGYPYEVYRFEGPYIAEVEQPKIVSVVELLEELAERRFLYFTRVAETVTWHDPCMLMRRSGVEPPEKLLDKVALFAKPKKYGKYATCCGGGMHMIFFLPDIAAKLGEVLEVDLVKLVERDRFVREIAEFGLKIAEHRAKELADSGARIVLTACYSCIEMLRRGFNRIGLPEADVKHIATYVADKIA